MEKKKLKLTISGSSKKTISNIEIAKSQGKNSVIIEKKPRYGNKPSFQKNLNQRNAFKPKQNTNIKKDTFVNPLMGWESSNDTLGEVKLKFSSKEKAIEYAKSNNIDYEIAEPQNSEFIIKSYADNFLKNN